jgi:L-threonylcarbamoyladenylate synthase
MTTPQSQFSTQVSTDVAEAVRHLEAGQLVGMPTETVYGLAGNALDPAVVLEIFRVKNRPSFDPLIVHLPDAEALPRFATDIPDAAQALAVAFWPGPLTLLLPRRALIPDLVCSGLPRVALRVPAHPMALALLSQLPFPLAAPSANPFGYISPTTAQHVLDQLRGLIPFVLDGGPCHVGVESTIVGFEAGETVVYRLGGLSEEALRSVAGPLRVQLNQGSNPSAPGMLLSHYAPRKPLLLNNLEENIRRHAQQKIAVLSFREHPGLPENCHALALSPQGDLAEAAQNLFAALRLLDQSDAELILAESVPDEGLGRAINDRLRRAST